MKNNTKKLTALALTISFAMVLSYIESRIPAFVAIPGIKIGLANIWMPILGWAIVGIFAATLVALIIRTQVQIKKEYKLSKTKAKETVKF